MVKLKELICCLLPPGRRRRARCSDSPWSTTTERGRGGFKYFPGGTTFFQILRRTISFKYLNIPGGKNFFPIFKYWVETNSFKHKRKLTIYFQVCRRRSAPTWGCSCSGGPGWADGPRGLACNKRKCRTWVEQVSNSSTKVSNISTKVTISPQKSQFLHKSDNFSTKVPISSQKSQFLHKSDNFSSKVPISPQKSQFLHKSHNFSTKVTISP